VRSEAAVGTYVSRVRITQLGSDRVLHTEERTMGVIRSDVVFSGWVVVVAVVSFVWLAATSVLFGWMVRSFGLRVLVLLSLLGSLQFVLSFVGHLLSSVLYAFLGPFNCLVGGLLTGVLTYLLVTSILFLVPRVGTMTLAGIVSYLMGGMLLGSFGLTDILFVGSSIAFREIFLFVFGVTTVRPHAGRIPAIVPMMLALGLADAASTFTSLTLHTVFFRLFFADWYIVLQVVVTGLLYTMIGVYLGRPLGRDLRRVHL
jgi:hypothetical protein